MKQNAIGLKEKKKKAKRRRGEPGDVRLTDEKVQCRY